MSYVHVSIVYGWMSHINVYSIYTYLLCDIIYVSYQAAGLNFTRFF